VIANSPLRNKPGRNQIGHFTAVRAALIQAGIYRQSQNESSGQIHSEIVARQETSPPISNDLWRISTTPYTLSRHEYRFLKILGNQLLSFYEASNRLYFESLNGQSPAWIADLLNQGKPESVIDYGRMKRFKQNLPCVIRPDLIPTNEGDGRDGA